MHPIVRVRKVTPCDFCCVRSSISNNQRLQERGHNSKKLIVLNVQEVWNDKNYLTQYAGEHDYFEENGYPSLQVGTKLCSWGVSISIYYFGGRYSQLKNRRIVRQLTVHVPTVSFRFFLTTFSLKQSETD